MTQAVKPVAEVEREDLPQNEGPDWDAIRDEKNRFIARQVALKCAVEMVAAKADKPSGGPYKVGDLKDLTDMFVRLIEDRPKSSAEEIPFTLDEDLPPFA